MAIEYLEASDRHVFNVVETDAEAPPPVEPYAAEAVLEQAPDYRYVIEQDEPLPPLDSNEFNFPTITETILDNGLEVVVIEQPICPSSRWMSFLAAAQRPSRKTCRARRASPAT